MQYHVEVEPDTVVNWGEVLAYRNALMTTLGSKGLTSMKTEADAHMSGFLGCAEKLYRNFTREVRR